MSTVLSYSDISVTFVVHDGAMAADNFDYILVRKTWQITRRDVFF